MEFRSSTLCLLALLAACGTGKSQLTSNDELFPAGGDGAAILSGTPSALALSASKMAEQTAASSQNQADQAEIATSGSDDDWGTGKWVQKRERGGELGIHPTPGVDYSAPISDDFDVALNFNAWLQPDRGTANGNVTVAVRHGHDGTSDDDLTLEGMIEHAYDDNRHILQSTEPNIRVTQKGNRGAGQVVREIRGVLRRVLQSAGDPNTDFNFLINHQSTVVTDVYTANALTGRTLSGVATVTDGNNASAVITFNDVVRPKPSVCLCPTQGSITIAYTVSGVTQTITNTFNGTCGQVAVTEPWSIEIFANAGTLPTKGLASSDAEASGSGSSSSGNAGSVSSGTAVGNALYTSMTTWDFCTPSGI